MKSLYQIIDNTENLSREEKDAIKQRMEKLPMGVYLALSAFAFKNPTVLKDAVRFITNK